MEEQVFEPGQILFRMGDPGDLAYQVQEGCVELLAGATEPYSLTGLCRPGDVLGEMVLVEERPRDFTARAVTAVRALAVSRDAFEHYLLTEPARICPFLRALFERLRSLTARGGLEPESVPQQTADTAAVDAAANPNPNGVPAAGGTSTEWNVTVHPLTRKAAETLPEEGLLVTHFPLRIGRAASAKEGEAMDLNDLWLLDDAPYNISRNHCEIDVDGNGPIVRDRGSQLGCFVNDVRIGQRGTRHARLESGDNVVVIGSRMSPYQFRVTVNP